MVDIMEVCGGLSALHLNKKACIWKNGIWLKGLNALKLALCTSLVLGETTYFLKLISFRMSLVFFFSNSVWLGIIYSHC